jgi:multidrug transporter EmrE-like cation transporter
MLYPVMALGYIWVPIASAAWFGESLNVVQMLGIAVIVSGVAILGRGGAR